MKVKEISEFKAKINDVYFNDQLVFNETRFSLELLESIAKVNDEIIKLISNAYEVAYDDVLTFNDTKSVHHLNSMINEPLLEGNMSLDEYKNHLRKALSEYGIEDLQAVDDLESINSNNYTIIR